MLDWLKPYKKAIVSALVAGVAMFIKVYTDNDSLSGEDWVAILGAAASAGGLTWLIPNSPKPEATPPR